MYRDRPERTLGGWLARAALALVVALALLLAGRAAARQMGADMDAQAAQALKNAVVSSAVQCYAVEGSYPVSLAYLEENYGLQVNHEKFTVAYEVFASNLLPDVVVYQR